jgi:hypothetical protein
MRPTKIGQVVKFHTPLPDEDPDQLYVVNEIIFDVENPRAHIQVLNWKYPFPSVSVVLVEELELAEVDTSDLIGYKVTVLDEASELVTGRAIKADEKKIIPDFNKGSKYIATNVRLTILDEGNKPHTGMLIVNEQTVLWNQKIQ